MAVVLGMSAVVGTPIRRVSIPLWIALVGLAIAGLAFESMPRAKTKADSLPAADGVILLASIALIVPVLILLPFFVFGFGLYSGTAHPDSWSYTVFGAYLSEYPRLTDGGLAPVYQWACHLSGTRYVAPSELAWLASATHEGDTQAALGLLLSLSTFTIGSACAAFGRELGLPNRLLLLAAAGAGGGNWIGNAILVSNLDNLLVLPFVPALAALGSEEPQIIRPGKAVIAGLLAAAILYTYPEFAGLCLFCGGLFFARTLLKMRVRQSLIAIGICALTVGLLTSPYAGELAFFLRTQVSAGVAKAPRPGDGVFNGLLDPALRLSAFWALGPESGTRPWLWLANVAAVGLSLLATAGIVRMVRLRMLGALATLVLLLAGFSVFVWQHQYAYGAYKFVMLGWWLVILAVVVGVHECSRVHPGLMAVAATLATATFAVSGARSVREVMSPSQPDMGAFRALRAVNELAPRVPVAIAVADNTAVHWATYFLRGSKTRLITYSGYLAAPHVYPAMLRAMPVPWESLRLLLTDARDPGPVVETQGWKLLWRNDVYTLWDTGSLGWMVVSQIENPYPYAANTGGVWIGDKPTRLIASASWPGIATIRAAALGADRPWPASLRPARILTTDGMAITCEWVVPESGASLVFGVHSGNNVLSLAKTWPRSQEVPAADERFPLLLMLSNPTLEFRRGAPDPSGSCPSVTVKTVAGR
jgi:hypothetical protein